MMIDFNDISGILDESNRTYKKDILDFDAVGEKLLNESSIKESTTNIEEGNNQQTKETLYKIVSDWSDATVSGADFFDEEWDEACGHIEYELKKEIDYGYIETVEELIEAGKEIIGKDFGEREASKFEKIAKDSCEQDDQDKEFADWVAELESIVNESLNEEIQKNKLLKESYAAAVYDPEDIRGETFYIDEDGELRDYLHQAKIFDTEEEAEEWAEENCPYNWNAYGSKLDEATIAQAKRFATRKHGERGQVRKATGAPYIVHPEGVAKIVKDFGGDDEQIQAAWLHDTMEDTGTWEEDLREKFGDRVADLVSELTNDDFAIRSIGKEDYMSNKLVNLSDDALLIKLSDFLYNIKDYCPMKTLERMKKNLEALNFSGRKLDDKCDKLLIDCLEAIDEEM